MPPTAKLDDLQYADLRTFRESVRGKTRWFEFSIPPLDIPANANFAAPIFRSERVQIAQDSHFLCQELTGVVLQGSGGGINRTMDLTANGMPLLQITDEGAGITLFDQPALWSAVVGVAQRPYRLKPPYLFRARTRIRVDGYNGDTGATALRLQLILGGTRVYLR